MAWFTEMDAQGRGQQQDAPLRDAIYCNKRKRKVKQTKQNKGTNAGHRHNFAVLSRLPVARYGADG
jgi:hypothetical protein